jgi:hypothetical protein
VNKLPRRSFSAALTVIPLTFALAKPANAFAFASILWTAFKILVGNAIRAVVTSVAPSLMKSSFSKFLVSVAISYGVSEAHAAVFAKGGVANDVEIEYSNPSDHIIEVRGAFLELVDVATGEVEQSEKLPYFLMPARKTESLQVTVKKFKTEGAKILRLQYQNQVLASSNKFYGVV